MARLDEPGIAELLEPQDRSNPKQHHRDRSGKERRFQGLPLVPEDKQGNRCETNQRGAEVKVPKYTEELRKRGLEIR